MAFSDEEDLQKQIHDNPNLIRRGIPELDPRHTEEVPRWVPLSREVSLNRGALDNLFIDVNGILTVVECKVYDNSGIKRDVYAQVMHYAADLQAQLQNFEGDQFFRQFCELFASGEKCSWEDFDEIVETLKEDDVLNGIDDSKWEDEFRNRLQENIRRGVFRIIILCGDAGSSFPRDNIRNLMQLMSYSERGSSDYDLLLMDIQSPPGTEETESEYRSRIIWRHYTPLPKLPLMEFKRRDTSEGIEKMQDRRKAVRQDNPDAARQLEELRDALKQGGLTLVENTEGEAVYRNGSSLYLNLFYDDDREVWGIKRHQIYKPDDQLYKQCGDGALEEKLREEFDWQGEFDQQKADTDKGEGVIYHVELIPDYDHPVDPAIVEYLGRQ